MKKASIVAGVPKLDLKPGPKPGHKGSWSPAPSTPTFPTSRVDVWKLHLDEPLNMESGDIVLSPDEIARASRFRFEKGRIHFTRCRSALRGVLSAYLLIPSAEIR